MAKILVIEDEQSLQTVLEYDLTQNNYEVDICGDGQEGFDLLKTSHYDLAIIDWFLPNLTGIEVIKRVREFNKTIRLIMLSVKDDEMDIVKGIDAGANDYVTKPFSPRELQARVRGLLRDMEQTEKNDGFVKVTKRLGVDYPKREVFLDNKAIELTKLEYDLFVFLVGNKNTVVTREQIMNHIWNYNYESKNRIIDVYIHSIKQKLDINDEIKSKRGVGYIFNAK